MLDWELNRKILRFTPKFEAKDFAPSTFSQLKNQSLGSLIVYAGSSHNTIYGENSVNHAFRAWHDSLHLKLNAPFTLEGETLVGLEQARLIGSETFGKIIMTEVVGQVEYNIKTGLFPINQEQFIINYLKGLIK
jgi:hypothetical protein